PPPVVDREPRSRVEPGRDLTGSGVLVDYLDVASIATLGAVAPSFRQLAWIEPGAARCGAGREGYEVVVGQDGVTARRHAAHESLAGGGELVGARTGHRGRRHLTALRCNR